MKAKKIVYLMLIMVVLISGCNHQNNNMEESKKTSFSNEKTSDSTTKPSSIVSTLFRQRQFPPLYLQRIITRKRMHLLDMQKQITLRKKLRILYITKMVKSIQQRRIQRRENKLFLWQNSVMSIQENMFCGRIN